MLVYEKLGTHLQFTHTVLSVEYLIEYLSTVSESYAVNKRNQCTPRATGGRTASKSGPRLLAKLRKS